PVLSLLPLRLRRGVLVLPVLRGPVGLVVDAVLGLGRGALAAQAAPVLAARALGRALLRTAGAGIGSHVIPLGCVGVAGSCPRPTFESSALAEVVAVSVGRVLDDDPGRG